jgi:adenylate cyclase
VDFSRLSHYNPSLEDRRLKRKLTAILAADVVGYSRLMALDEAGTIAGLQAHRDELIDPKIAQYNGRIVKLMGDGILMEFASVVEAVELAIEVQAAMRERNIDCPDEKKIVFRVGINLGDVVVQEEDILGEGVNLTARLEAHAQPGGICISASAYEQLSGRLDLNVEDLGLAEFKNIKDPVHVYAIQIDEKAKALCTPVVASVAAEGSGISGRKHLYGGLLLLFLVVAGGVFWWQPWLQRFEPAQAASMVLALPDKPSIAVLPFDNFSSDKEQEYFADGMTEDLLTGLSQLSGLFVISRNTSFTYKDKPVKIREVAEELGVRYVLEGSVRRSDDQLRINVQLIDALSGYHVWAKKYDREMKDVFALQDEVVGAIVTSMADNLLPDLVAADKTDNPEAYDNYLQGREYARANTPRDFLKAISFFQKAIEIDPGYTGAHAALAEVYWDIFDNSWGKRTGLETTDSVELSKKHLAIALEDQSAVAKRLSAKISLWSGNHDKALQEISKAIELSPNDADNYDFQAAIQIYAGEAAEAEKSAHTAMRLNPHYPARYLRNLGRALFHQDRFAEALEVLQRAVKWEPEYDYNYPILTATYGHLNKPKEAKAALEKMNLLRKFSEGGDFTVQNVADWTPFKYEADLARYQDGLRKGGVPDAVATANVDFESLVTKSSAGFTIDGIRKIDLSEAQELHADGVLFVDTRSSNSGYPIAHIPGAVWLDYKTKLTAENLAEHAGKNSKIVFYCDGPYCYKSAYACAKATTWGYTDVVYFAGGMPAWNKAGLETEAQ